MSNIADCPDCGKTNCTTSLTPLNYCMWCGRSFREKPEQKKLVEELIIDEKSGQVKLF